MKFVDTAGRIDKFNKKFASFNKKGSGQESQEGQEEEATTEN